MSETDASPAQPAGNRAQPIAEAVREFMQMESSGGILLLLAAVLAMLVANSPLAEVYNAFLQLPVAVQIGALAIDKPLLLWVNDGLMAIFFFLVGLEIKREVMEGELSSFSQIVLPGMGAIGGMLVPALIYAAFNWGDTVAMDGWAIPVATDIAFALARTARLVWRSRTDGPQNFPADAGYFRRPGSHRHHRAVLFRRSVNKRFGDRCVRAGRCRVDEPAGCHAHLELHPVGYCAVGGRPQVRRACDAGRRAYRVLYSDA